MTGIVELAERLRAMGFNIQLWRDKRIYVRGYGRDISAYLEPLPGSSTADGARVVVGSNWRSAHQALRAKSVKHAILHDLFAVGLLSEPPPRNWRDVGIDDRPPLGRFPHSSQNSEPPFEWPDFIGKR